MRKNVSGARFTARLSSIEVSAIVDADREELFHFTEWCYNDSVYDSEVKEANIIKLPDSAGIGKVSHHVGNVMGCKVAWEGESVAWKKNEYWAMKATKGLFASLSMRAEMRFYDTGPKRTKVTFHIDYGVPYPIMGLLIDALFLRRVIHRLAKTALQGLQKAAALNKILPIPLQLEKRRANHPGYTLAD